MTSGQTGFTLQEIAEKLGVEFRGDPTLQINGLATLQSAKSTDLSVYHNPKYRLQLKDTQAAAVILHPRHADDCPVDMLISEKPYLTFADSSALFSSARETLPGIHPTAVIDSSVQLGQDVAVGPFTVIEAGAIIGDRVVIGAHCTIGGGTVIGNDSWFYPRVTIYPGVSAGSGLIVHSGVVIGSDGFGFAADGYQQKKIEQLGKVVIGDNVEVGANTTIDRGALDDTVIGDGVKIDNQVQIAHNVIVGDNTVICGCSAIAGSANIGANCIIAGAVGIINHISVVDGVTVTAMSLVNQDIEEPGIYSSGTGLGETGQWKRNMLRFRELDDMAKTLRKLLADKE